MSCELITTLGWELHLLFFRWACSIQEEQEVTITGGKYSYTKVTTYQMNGEAQELPDLITGRGYHACGHFKNSDGDIVGVDMSF